MLNMAKKVIDKVVPLIVKVEKEVLKIYELSDAIGPMQEREQNPASTKGQVDDTTLYVEAPSGAKRRNFENTDGGDAHQGHNIGHSYADRREEDDHDGHI
ncbi:hypothetical protein Tco_0482241 [Tanacetum coccineum]